MNKIFLNLSGTKNISIVLDGSGLRIEKLVRIARHNEKVELHSDALERIKKRRLLIEKK